MIAPNGEHPEAAQQIQIAAALTVIEILPRAAAKADIVSDRLEYPHHLLVEMAAMHRETLGFALCEQCGDIVCHADQCPTGAAAAESVRAAEIYRNLGRGTDVLGLDQLMSGAVERTRPGLSNRRPRSSMARA